MTTKKDKKIKKVPAKNTKKSAAKVVKPVKKPIKKIEKDVEEIDEIEIDVDEVSDGKGKVKKTIEIDAADILPEVEEKVLEEESPLLGLEDEDSDESIGIDSEDLNPFGDKWEM